MKRLIATICLLCYFGASSGATIQLHYCMDKLVSWSLNTKEKFKCSVCGMQKKGHKGCCHDDNKQIKIEKDYKASGIIYDFSGISLLPLKYPTEVQTLHSLIDTEIYTFSHAPPRTLKVPAYLSNRVFRI
jgi:hypothetical protein